MTLWLADAPLVLASKSPIRRQLLQAAGISVEVCPADIDERAIEEESGAASPEAVATLLAARKAKAVSAAFPGRWVLGADQTLGFNGNIFSKAADFAAARGHLTQFRGQTHALHAALTLVRDGTVAFEHVAAARLTMREFSDSFLDAYMQAAGDLVLQSVGGYQLEGLGVQLFSRIDGDHSTILGLPLIPLLAHLRCVGLLAA